MSRNYSKKMFDQEIKENTIQINGGNLKGADCTPNKHSGFYTSQAPSSFQKNNKSGALLRLSLDPGASTSQYFVVLICLITMGPASGHHNTCSPNYGAGVCHYSGIYCCCRALQSRHRAGRWG